MKIKDLPVLERPYEKLEKYGAKKLSDAELLAVIIKTGTKEDTSVSLAQKILLKDYENKGLRFLNNITIDELMKIKGIGKVKAFQLKALVELSRRIAMPINIDNFAIRSPIDVFNILVGEMRYEKEEILKVLILNNKNRILKICDIARGNLNSVAASPKQVLLEPIKLEASGIILVHNHPSRRSYT